MMNILLSEKESWNEHFIESADHAKHRLTCTSFDQTLDLKRYDLVLPLTIEDQKFLLEHYPQYLGKKYFVPTVEVMDRCDDKLLFNEYLTKVHLDDFIPAFGNHLRPPYIIKKRVAAWGQHCHIIQSKEEEHSFISLLHQPEYFKQALVSGKKEYTMHFLYWEGKLIFDFTIEFTYQTDLFIKGAPNPTTEAHSTFADQVFRKTFCSILSALDYQGFGCINYKIDNYSPIIFEINPRIGASLPQGFTHMTDALSNHFSWIHQHRYR